MEETLRWLDLCGLCVAVSELVWDMLVSTWNTLICCVVSHKRCSVPLQRLLKALMKYFQT